ncbi:MAG: hypothetical protein KGO02_05310 [Alphaproteobacteria bacterium]|nr:hypothetical protein [Alphaproteobacteria bacterium]
MLKALELMLDRVTAHGADSDITMFTELLYAGELILKATTGALVALVQNDRDSHRYRLLHGLVRADGVGEWAAAIDQTLVGPTSHHLVPAALDIRRDFTQRSNPASWQDRAVKSLFSVLAGVYPQASPPAERPQLRSWFQLFSELRNKTRGHGALTPATASRLVADLDTAVKLMGSHNPVLQAPWAYLHRNLSGKYRVVPLGGDGDAFSDLKTSKAFNAENYPPGVYIYVGGYQRVELLYTDADASDFFVPNGAFRNGTYELHSLISDNRRRGDATPYLLPATERPPSDTEGTGSLEPLGNVFANLPPGTPGYIGRPKLEAEIRHVVEDDRHPIVTLVGRGGIGKTSTALAVLHELANGDRFEMIVWFSARDIDLTLAGAKAVKPKVLTETEIATEYMKLIGYKKSDDKEAPISVMAAHLARNPLGKTLFVFDNFETVRSPIDLFAWIDTNIRLPNKVIITSRFRDFKADYPISVPGMEEKEAEELILRTAETLKIQGIIGSKEKTEIFEESDGHPYIIRIMLGEIATRGSYSKPARLIARKEDILDAIFERTYASLSPLSARAFLILSSWRSIVPQLAVEATLMRYTHEAIDPESAIDQLVRTSLIERLTAPDDSDFLEVPLTAATFGKQKLEVSPIRATVENDVRFLQDVGATRDTGLKEGLAPKIDALFRRVARKVMVDKSSLEEVRPILEFLASQHQRAWLLLAGIDQELGDQERAAESLRRFLSSRPEPQLAQRAWQQLVDLYRASGEVIAACDAFCRASAIAEPPLSEVSSLANWLNNSSISWSDMNTADRATIFHPLASMMEEKLEEATATDISRVAWLRLHMGSESQALALAKEGLDREPDNIHCLRLYRKLTNV